MTTTTRAYTFADLVQIYGGSDGEATKALYADLQRRGPVGVVAVNLFRASKCSARAKVYRGGIPGQGSYKDMAYRRKQWSLENLDKALAQHAARLGIAWGWKLDPEQPFHKWVLYVDLPMLDGTTVQVSFHTDTRGAGPGYTGEWDGVRGVSPDRILRWIARLQEATP